MTIRHFWKYNGSGNDFIILWRESGETPVSPADAIRLCGRKTGVSGLGVTGADGILELSEPSGAVPNADVQMRIVNADGSEAEMCGNGLRCAALFLEHRDGVRYGHFGDTEIGFETAGGYRSARLIPRSDGFNIETFMGEAILDAAHIPVALADGSGPFIQQSVEVTMPNGSVQTVVGTAVSMGNPHFVLLDPPDLSDEDFHHLAPLLEKHPLFPRKTNVELIRPIAGPGNPPALRMTVWERGCGWTKACGTGACAAAAAYCLVNRQKRGSLEIRMPGGAVRVSVIGRRKGKSPLVYLYGTAQMDFEGELELTD